MVPIGHVPASITNASSTLFTWWQSNCGTPYVDCRFQHVDWVWHQKRPLSTCGKNIEYILHWRLNTVYIINVASMYLVSTDSMCKSKVHDMSDFNISSVKEVDKHTTWIRYYSRDWRHYEVVMDNRGRHACSFIVPCGTDETKPSDRAHFANQAHCSSGPT
jgi:hypothetical protein